MSAKDVTTSIAAQTPGTRDLIAHLQSATEHQKALLARELHDELGGLLVGAVMDLAWAEQHLSAPPTELKQKLARARQTLSAAIDLKRRLIEDLRPTLLDNVGLFAALRWHAQAVCKRAGVPCVIHLPDEERRFLPNIPIALFRIVQEAFEIMVGFRRATAAELQVVLNARELSLRMSNEMTPPVSAPMNSAEAPAQTEAETHSLAAIGQRVLALGGEFTLSPHSPSGSSMTAVFPVGSVVATPSI